MKITRRSTVMALSSLGALSLSSAAASSLVANNRKNEGDEKRSLSSLVLIDPTIKNSIEQLLLQKLAYQSKSYLGEELVRHWRDELREDIRRTGTAIAYVRWDKSLLLQGLAREERFQSWETEICRGVFRLDIARSA